MQTFFLALAVGTIFWLLWRQNRQSNAIKRLNRALTGPGIPDRASLGFDDAPESLRTLARTTLDGMTEARLHSEMQVHHRRFMEALLHQIEDALFVLDENLEIRFSNHAAERFFPMEVRQVGRSLIEVCLDHRIVETVNLAVELGAKTQEHISRKTSPERDANDARTEKTWLVEAEPLSEVSGISGAWLVVRDVTEKLETEQIRRDFVANASHELRTPLSIIHGYLEMLSSDPLPPAEMIERAVATMNTHTDRIIRTVEDMLTVSRLESTESLLRKEEFDLAECVLNTIEQLQPIITRQNAKVKVSLDPEHRKMDGDRFYWNQILFNLMENALKQNDNRPLVITITSRHDNGRLCISVSDNGVGIPAAHLPLVFKRFYRVDKHHSQTRKGTGLGLSIVKRAVEAHHGTITVSSRPGFQTTFEIVISETVSHSKEKAGSSTGNT